MNLHLRQAETSEAVPASTLALLPAATEAIPTGHVEQQWRDALTSINLIATAKSGVAVRVMGRQSPAQIELLSRLHELASANGLRARRTTSATPASRWLPTLDLAATLDAGRPVMTSGTLERAAGGILIVAGAERLTGEQAALIARALDEQTLKVVALDEASPDDEAQLPTILAERMTVTVKTDGVPLSICRGGNQPDPAAAQEANSPELEPGLLLWLASTLDALNRPSPRTLLHCSQVARSLAGLDGCAKATAAHAHYAIQLVLGVTLTAPQPPQDEEHDTQEQQVEPETDRLNAPPEQDAMPSQSGETASQDLTVESEAGVMLDPRLLQSLTAELAERKAHSTNGASSGAGAKRRNARRGRPIGHSENPPHQDARPDILATLRAAAPWQTIRKASVPAQMADRLQIRSSDFRYKRLHQPRETLTIFVVDASGSTATQRLGEAKGAIERFLTDCYVRRDNVALVAFRGRRAEVLLEPTRSLVRAKKGLAGLPGGGPTPLASGLNEGAHIALRAQREGQTALMVVLSDGSANIALNEEAGRSAAHKDALKAAQQIKAYDIACLFVDTSRRPRAQAYEIATALGAEHIPMPPSRADQLDRIVANRLQSA
ncbi:MAG: VWA domain-containing protein [Pseudomonadota bacterium]